MELLQRFKKWLIIALSCLCLLMVIVTSVRGSRIADSSGIVLASVFGFFTDIGDWFSDRIDFFVNMNDLHEENRRLTEEIQRLEIEVSRLLYVEAENRVLVELMDIPRQYSEFPLMGANIIAQNPSNWFNNIMINRGIRDGIEINMVVLAPGGLAGRVSRVGINYAIVTTLIEDFSTVSAETRRTADIGMVRGDINLTSFGLLRMDRIALTADIAAGDEIITSQISSIYPPGIQIGHVISLETDTSGARYALIQPSVNFSDLSALMIITELFHFEMLEENEE